jgi:tetratricopeptide (TPR) repeat protein
MPMGIAVFRLGAWLVGSALLLLVLASNAQVVPFSDPKDRSHGPFNYYDMSQPRYRTLLYNVDKYHLNEGMEKMRKKQYAYAKSDFHFMLTYFPNHPKALLLMGELSLKIKRPDSAKEYFEHALELYPGIWTTHSVYGIFLHKAGKLDEAIEQYRRALTLNPGAADTTYNLGLAYLDKGEYALANEYARKAQALGHPLSGLEKKLKQLGKWKSD